MTPSFIPDQLLDPNNLLGAPESGMDRDVTVDLGNGRIEHMQESALVRVANTYEDENEIVWWVQYHLPRDGKLVHRSVHLHLKKMPVSAEGVAASFA